MTFVCWVIVFNFFNLYFNFVYMGVLPVCMSVYHVCVHGSQKRLLDSLGLELKIVVSCLEGAGN